MGNNCTTKPRPVNSQIIVDDMNPTQQQNYQIGKMYENRAQFQQAQLYYTLAVRANPHSAMSYCGLGNCWLKRGDYMRALDYYQTAVGHDPNCKYAYNGIGVIYENVKNDTKSIQNFNKAIEIDPSFSYPYNGLGNLHNARKNYAQALKNYENALKLDPSNTIILANIACCQANLGHTEQAMASFKKIHNALSQDEAMTPTNRIYLIGKMKQFEAGLRRSGSEQLQSFQQITNQNPNIYQEAVK